MGKVKEKTGKTTKKTSKALDKTGKVQKKTLNTKSAVSKRTAADNKPFKLVMYMCSCNVGFESEPGLKVICKVCKEDMQQLVRYECDCGEEVWAVEPDALTGCMRCFTLFIPKEKFAVLV